MKKLDKIWIGIIVGFIAPIMVVYIIFQMGGFMETPTDFRALSFNPAYSIVILKPSLLINLVFFLVFINQDCLKFSRGVVFSTMAYALLVVASYIL